MDEPVKHAVITSFLSTTKDRFHQYNVTKTLEERLQMASEMKGVSGVEMVFPYEVCDDPKDMKKLLDKFSLGISAVNVNVKAEPGVSQRQPYVDGSKYSRQGRRVHKKCKGLCQGGWGRQSHLLSPCRWVRV